MESVTGRWRAFLLSALIDLCISIDQFDGNVMLKLAPKPHCLHAGQGLDEC